MSSNCFICYESLHSNNCFSFSTCLKHSELEIGKVLEDFLSEQQSVYFESNQAICAKCLPLLNQYDLANQTLKKLKRLISEKILITDQTYRQSDKVEVLELTEFEVFQRGDDNHFEFSENDNEFEVETKSSIDDLHEIDQENEPLIVYLCALCKKEFERPQELVLHKKNGCQIETLKECCAECDKSFPTKAQLKNHYFQLHRSKKCGVCHKVFDNLVELKDHHHQYHEVGKNFSCPICKTSLTSEWLLHRHVKQAHVESEKSESPEIHTCDICGKIENNSDDLRQHVEKHNNRLECTVCGKIVKHRPNLVLHMRIHTGEQFYQCDKCGKQFVHKSSLRMHLQTTHNDERTKQCPKCPLRFKTTSQLNQHASTHSGVRNHKCPECGRGFIQRYNMMAHFRLHLGIRRQKTNKVHNCRECDKTFDRLNQLRTHLRRVHKIIEIEANESDIN